MAKVKTKKSESSDTKEIKYYTLTATCACGAEYQTGSTLKSIRVDVCANCHPFFTGENRILDAEGRVEKFRKKYKLAKK